MKYNAIVTFAKESTNTIVEFVKVAKQMRRFCINCL